MSSPYGALHFWTFLWVEMELNTCLTPCSLEQQNQLMNYFLKRHKPIRRWVQELIRVVWKWKHNTLPSKWRNVACLHVRGVMKPILSIPKQSLRKAMKQWNQALFQTDEIVVFMTAEYFKTWKHKTTLGPTTRFLFWDQMLLDNNYVVNFLLFLLKYFVMNSISTFCLTSFCKIFCSYKHKIL